MAAFEGIFGATTFFGTDTSSGRAKVVQRFRFNFFREARIWYSRDLDQCPLSEQFENVIVLSDEFYREISAHAIPADLEAVKVLAGAPAVLDLFVAAVGRWLDEEDQTATERCLQSASGPPPLTNAARGCSADSRMVRKLTDQCLQ